MSTPHVSNFLLDDGNIGKFETHGLTDTQIEQVLDWPYVVMRNRRRRRAQYLIIGRDDSGICIAVPIERTHEPDVWRPVTAWRCKAGESKTYDRLVR